MESCLGCLGIFFAIYLFAIDWRLGLLAIGAFWYLGARSGKASKEEKEPDLREILFEKTPPTKNAGTSPAHGIRWYGMDESIATSGCFISSPLTYASSKRIGVDESSCIDLSLRVGKVVNEPRGSLGYWPRYSGLSPNQRANYLNWMASGRTAPLDDIGYTFIFYYGLERRALLDEEDLHLVIEEVLRLRQRYQFSKSFNSYSANFLAYLLAKTDLASMAQDTFMKVIASIGTLQDDILSVVLAWFYYNRKPLPDEVAYEIAKNLPGAPRSVVLKRAPEEFKLLFKNKYQAKFGQGMELTVVVQLKKISYHIASPSLPSTLIKSISIPDVVGAKEQFTPLLEIWSQCIEELRKFSRALSQGMKTTDRDAYMALPKILRREVDHPDKPLWETLVTENLSEKGYVVVEVAQVAELLDMPQKEKFTVKQSEIMAENASEAGYQIVPDIRITGRAYSALDKVSLVPQEPDQNPGSEYPMAAFMLELGMIVANADGEIEDVEIAQIAQILETQFQLTHQGGKLLKAYGHILFQQPPSLARISVRLKAALTTEQRWILARNIVQVAAANGKIIAKERNSLRSIFKALEIEEKELELLLDEIQIQPVRIIQGQQEKQGEVIPLKEENETPLVQLDQERLKYVMAQTQEVSKILGQVLSQTEEQEEEIIQTQEEQVQGPWEDLGGRYVPAFKELINRAFWMESELIALARKHDLMPLDLIDTINVWAEEQLGDFLIEDDENYLINKELLEGVNWFQ